MQEGHKSSKVSVTLVESEGIEGNLVKGGSDIPQALNLAHIVTNVEDSSETVSEQCGIN